MTEAGATLYGFVSRGVEEMDAGLLALTERGLRGRLRFVNAPSFEPMWQLIDQFQEHYPNIEIDLFG